MEQYQRISGHWFRRSNALTWMPVALADVPTMLLAPMPSSMAAPMPDVRQKFSEPRIFVVEENSKFDRHVERWRLALYSAELPAHTAHIDAYQAKRQREYLAQKDRLAAIRPKLMRIRNQCRVDHKAVPSLDELEKLYSSMYAADFVCPDCSKTMVSGKASIHADRWSLQHYEDGSFGFICVSCNSRSGVHTYQVRNEVRDHAWAHPKLTITKVKNRRVWEIRTPEKIFGRFASLELAQAAVASLPASYKNTRRAVQEAIVILDKAARREAVIAKREARLGEEQRLAAIYAAEQERVRQCERERYQANWESGGKLQWWLHEITYCGAYLRAFRNWSRIPDWELRKCILSGDSNWIFADDRKYALRALEYKAGPNGYMRRKIEHFYSDIVAQYVQHMEKTGRDQIQYRKLGKDKFPVPAWRLDNGHD